MLALDNLCTGWDRLHCCTSSLGYKRWTVTCMYVAAAGELIWPRRVWQGLEWVWMDLNGFKLVWVASCCWTTHNLQHVTDARSSSLGNQCLFGRSCRQHCATYPLLLTAAFSSSWLLYSITLRLTKQWLIDDQSWLKCCMHAAIMATSHAGGCCCDRLLYVWHIYSTKLVTASVKSVLLATSVAWNTDGIYSSLVACLNFDCWKIFLVTWSEWLRCWGLSCYVLWVSSRWWFVQLLKPQSDYWPRLGGWCGRSGTEHDEDKPFPHCSCCSSSWFTSGEAQLDSIWQNQQHQASAPASCRGYFRVLRGWYHRMLPSVARCPKPHHWTEEPIQHNDVHKFCCNGCCWSCIKKWAWCGTGVRILLDPCSYRLLVHQSIHHIKKSWIMFKYQ